MAAFLKDMEKKKKQCNAGAHNFQSKVAFRFLKRVASTVDIVGAYISHVEPCYSQSSQNFLWEL